MNINISQILDILWANKDLILVIILAIIGYLYPTAPADIRKVLNKIGGNKFVIALIQETNHIHAAKTDMEKLDLVAEQIIIHVKAATGKTISKTNALWIVQNAYKIYKRIMKD